MEDDDFLVSPAHFSRDESSAFNSSSIEEAPEIVLSDKLREYINGHTRRKVLGLESGRTEHVFRP